MNMEDETDVEKVVLVVKPYPHGPKIFWKKRESIREAFAALGVAELSIPKDHSLEGGFCIRIPYDDARTLLRDDPVVTFSNMPYPVLLDDAHKAMSVQVMVNPTVELSFTDASSLLDLLPYSTRVLDVERSHENTYNVFFAKAWDIRRFLMLPPPCIEDFPENVNLKFTFQLFSLTRDGFKAARLLDAFPVLYDFPENRESKNRQETKDKIRRAADGRLSMLHFPYPADQRTSGVMFFTKFEDAKEFIRYGPFCAGVNIHAIDCVFNKQYFNFIHF